MGSTKKFKCKDCGTVFDEERRYLNHKKVHGRKIKTTVSYKIDDRDAWIAGLTPGR